MDLHLQSSRKSSKCRTLPTNRRFQDERPWNADFCLFERRWHRLCSKCCAAVRSASVMDSQEGVQTEFDVSRGAFSESAGGSRGRITRTSSGAKGRARASARFTARVDVSAEAQAETTKRHSEQAVESSRAARDGAGRRRSTRRQFFVPGGNVDFLPASRKSGGAPLFVTLPLFIRSDCGQSADESSGRSGRRRIQCPAGDQ